MPSRTEALGLALLEAGYAGLPSIAARVGGIPEVVKHKDTGLLVPKENPHVLARAIRILLARPEEAKAYAEKLQKKVTERYGKVRMLEETFLLYR
jgi:glycosyltransferase involved in cell wall biosynthesis